MAIAQKQIGGSSFRNLFTSIDLGYVFLLGCSRLRGPSVFLTMIYYDLLCNVRRLKKMCYTSPTPFYFALRSAVKALDQTFFNRYASIPVRRYHLTLFFLFCVQIVSVPQESLRWSSPRACVMLCPRERWPKLRGRQYLC